LKKINYYNPMNNFKAARHTEYIISEK